MDSPNTLRHRLEALVVGELEKDLQGDKITGERAQEIASIFLEAVPENITDSELLKIIPLLDDKASELAPVVFKILSERDEQEKTKQLDHLRMMIGVCKMADLSVESPQPRHYRRHEAMTEYRDVKANERKQKIEKSAEREHKRQEAIKAISKDKPNVPERIDLENLAGLPGTIQAETVVNQEASEGDMQVSEIQTEEVAETSASEEAGEDKLIYAESFLDPDVRKIYLEVRKETDENSQVKRAENPMVPSYIDTWNQVRNEIGSKRWDQFVIDYPEKAQAYAKNDKWIKAALERLNGVSEPSVEQEFKLRRNDKSNGADTWYGQGNLSTEGDVLIYSRERNKPTNIFAPDSKLHDQEEERLAKNYSPRRLGLAVVDAALSGEAGREVKVPSAILWKILETNPKELGTKTAVRLGPRTNSSLLERFSPIHVQRWRETTFDLPDNDVRTFKPFELKVRNSDGDERTIEVNSSWKKLTVDQKTLTAMQQKAVEYIEQQVNSGNMPADLLDAARGLLLSHQAQDTVRFAPFKKKVGGESPASPREHATLLQNLVPDVWTASGSLRQDGRNIVYENDNLRRKKDARSVQIATADTKDETRIVLTRQAWDILERVPTNIKDKNSAEYRTNMPNALTNPTQDRQGLWKRFVKPFTADSDTLMKMQGMIRDYVADNVAKETMDESFLKAVDGIIKYKHSIYPGTR